MKPKAHFSLLLAAFALGWISFAVPARASSDYPGIVQQHLSMPCTPQCTICHRDLLGGRGTVVKPFGISMLEAGLTFSTPDSVDPALDDLDMRMVDSDNDGVPDITELRQGDDPNAAGQDSLCGQTGPRYGCGAHIAPEPEPRSAAWAVALAAVFGLAARRRRFTRSRSASRPG